MSKVPDIIRPIYLQSLGEITKQKYFGTFRIKVILTQRERLLVEREYSALLPSDKGASEENKLRAAVLAELSVRIAESPDWWKNSDYGRELLDSQPLWDLMVSIDKERNAWQEELDKLVGSIKESND